MADKVPLILYSGGIDSTQLVVEGLCKRMQFSDFHKNAAAKGKVAKDPVVMKKE